MLNETNQTTISELTDTQLNRAVIWLYYNDDSYVSYSRESPWYWIGMTRLDYLNNWDLLMTLVVENKLEHEFGYDGHELRETIEIYKECKIISEVPNAFLQRAYAEALVYLKVGV